MLTRLGAQHFLCCQCVVRDCCWCDAWACGLTRASRKEQAPDNKGVTLGLLAGDCDRGLGLGLDCGFVSELCYLWKKQTGIKRRLRMLAGCRYSWSSKAAVPLLLLLQNGMRQSGGFREGRKEKRERKLLKVPIVRQLFLSLSADSWLSAIANPKPYYFSGPQLIAYNYNYSR